MTSADGEAEFFTARRVAGELSAGNVDRPGQDGQNLETQASPRTAQEIEAGGLRVGARPLRGPWRLLLPVLALRDRLGQ